MQLDGRAEIFIRITGDLTLWHMYQTDAKNPLAWDRPRGPVCLCNFPPCKGQTKCGIAGSCDNKGVDCNHQNPADYWCAPAPTRLALCNRRLRNRPHPYASRLRRVSRLVPRPSSDVSLTHAHAPRAVIKRLSCNVMQRHRPPLM